MDGTDLEGRVKNFDRFAVIVEHSGADHMIFKHAIAAIRVAAPDEQLLLVARSLIGNSPTPTASSSSSSTASASANCPTPRPTATRAATPSATSRRACRCGSRTCARSGCHASWTSAASGRPAPLGAYGRMAEASPGKDSVTGHWEMMGLVLERPFPTFPDGFPRELHATSSSAASGAGRSAT